MEVYAVSPLLLTVNFMSDELYINKVLLSRASMNSARVSSDAAASEYREAVRSAVSYFRSIKYSYKKIAGLIGVTEGALREILRPPGTARGKVKKERSFDIF